MTVYFEQAPTVVKGRGDANDAVRVKFSDVTLALSLVEASWLAENLGRVIREVKAARREVLPLHEQLLLFNLQVGDKVLVQDDAGNKGEYLVKQAPWMLGHGAWVVGLSGISGGYSLEWVVGILEKAKP
jgi:hypothetical protein